MSKIEKAILGGAVSLVLSVCLQLTVVCEDFTGKVVGVSDGDTITVMHRGRGERIRLHGIDAPEKGQPFTNRVKQFVSDLCYRKEVRVQTEGQDRYQRTIADVTLPDGRILNYEIVKAGSLGGSNDMRRTTQHWRDSNSRLEKRNAAFGFYVIQCHRGNSEGTSR